MCSCSVAVATDHKYRICCLDLFAQLYMQEELALCQQAVALLRRYSVLQFIAVTRGGSAALMFEQSAGSSSSSYTRSNSNYSGSSNSNSSSNSNNSNSSSSSSSSNSSSSHAPGARYQYTRCSIPKVHALNATGAGDCTSAIMLRAWVAGLAPVAALRLALAAAGASCLR